MKNILIIEDDSDSALLLSQYLESKGYHTATVENGLEGLTLIKFLKPDVVVVDLALPGMDGMSLIRRLRENIYLQNKMVIVVSGHFEKFYPGNKVDGIEADAVFSKPYNLSAVQKAILSYFKPRQQKPRPKKTAVKKSK